MPKNEKKEKITEGSSGLRARLTGFCSSTKEAVTEKIWGTISAIFSVEESEELNKKIPTVVQDDSEPSDEENSYFESSDEESSYFEPSDEEDTFSDISISALPDPEQLLEQRKARLYWTDEVLENNTHYQGTKTIVQQQKDGTGVYKTSTQIYCGQWKQDKKHGYGCQVYNSVDDDLHLLRELGRWSNGELRDGYVVARLPFENRLVASIIYQGIYCSGKREGLGELIIQMKNREAYSVVARWLNNKMEKTIEHGIKIAENKILVDLSQWIVDESTEANGNLLFSLARFLKGNGSNNANLTKVIDRLPDDCDKNFTQSLMKLNDLHQLIDTTKIYFAHPSDYAKANVVNTLRNQLNIVTVKFRRDLFRALRDPSFDFSQSNESIREVIDCIYTSINSSSEEVVFFVKASHIRFFLEMLNWVLHESSQFEHDFREKFINQYAGYLKGKWEKYLEEVKRKKIRFSEKIQNNLNCLLSLFKLQTVILKHLYQLEEKNILRQEKHHITLDESALPDTLAAGMLKYYYNTTLQFLDNYDFWYQLERDRAPQAIVFRWVGGKQSDFNMVNTVDIKYCSAEIDKQVWIHLNYFNHKIISNNVFGQIFKTEENFIKFIQQSNSMYENWREIFQLLLRYKLFVLHEGDFYSESLLSKKIEQLASVNEIELFSSILDVYLTHHVEESRLMNALTSLGYNKKLKSFRQFKIAYDTSIKKVLDIKCETRKSHDFFVQLNDFLIQLQFLSYEWFVDDKTCQTLINPAVSSEIAQQYISQVNATTQMHRISSVNEFKPAHLALFENTPHYVFDFLTQIVELIFQVKFSNKQTGDGELLTAYTSLIKTSLQLLVYFSQQQTMLIKNKESSLEEFVNKLVEPMRHIARDNSTLQDIIRKCGLIERYILFTRQIEQIDLDSAIKKFKERGTDILPEEEESLRHCFQAYKDKFSEFLKGYIDTHSSEERKQEVKSIIEKTSNLSIDREGKALVSWTYEQRKKYIPQVLAGVSVILSLQESGFLKKHTAYSTDGYFLQPHCIQILGALRLLAVDNRGKITNHLGEILTGQGKSWVLGLTAVIIALTGNRVMTVCYSETLTQRDRNNFNDLFKCFHVKEKITYCTLDKLSHYSVTLGSNYDMDDLIRLLLSNKRPQLSLTLPNISNTVLLVDEVDVLFSLLGKSRRICVIDVRDVFSQLQKRIWQAVKEGTLDKEQFMPTIDFIEGDGALSKHVCMRYHVNQMLDAAKNCQSDTTFRLNPSSGNVERLTKEEKYSSHSYLGYYNSFHYLRLCDKAKRDYGKAMKERYGYLQVSSGIFSYIELAKQYPLMLGVSGSLKQLVCEEKKVLTEFNIQKNSYYPTFFGKSLLKFDSKKKEHFQLVEGKTNWTNIVIQQAQIMVEKGQSVLIFFETHAELKAFYEEHARAKLGKVLLLEPETEFSKKESIVNGESGLPKRVTLLTRGYGRGEDFRASAATNKNGGMHVIQTFLSIDPKEETQIQGRTARKNNPGSYSLVLHLKQVETVLGKAVDKNISFETLAAWRENKFREEFREKSKQAKAITERHNMTMQLRNEIYGFFSQKKKGTRENLLSQLHGLTLK